MFPSTVATIATSFVAAVLSGMGIGSAGLFVLYLTLVAGYSQPEAQAVNLLFFLVSAGTSLLIHRKERRIPRRVALFLIAWAIPGALAGSYLVRVLDATLIRRLFGGMLVATGLPALLSRREPEKQRNHRPLNRRKEG